MNRSYSDYTNANVKHALDLLVDSNSDSTVYRDAMYLLGTNLAAQLNKQLPTGVSISLAGTAEDIDFLAKGIWEALALRFDKMFLNVFWNKRFTPSPENGIAVAPILKEFHDEGYAKSDVLIIVKSIIATSCVIRTNLNRLIETTNPMEIFVVSPVMYKNARTELEKEFPEEISNRFQYVYFAIDDDIDKDGMVRPGIGGDVYLRLGLGNQDAKNRFTPELVLKRRQNNMQKVH